MAATIIISAVDNYSRQLNDTRRSINNISRDIALNRQEALKSDAANKAALLTKNKELAAEKAVLTARAQKLALQRRTSYESRRASRQVLSDLSAIRRGLEQVNHSYGILREYVFAIGTRFVIQGFRGAIEAATEVDSLRSTLTALLGDVDLANQRLARFRELAKLPGVTFRSAVRASIDFEAMGRTAAFAERAVVALGNAGALAGENIEVSMQRATLAISQIIGRGQLEQEELNQLREASRLNLVAIQREFGTADAETIRYQGIGAEEFVERFISALERLPKASADASANVFNNFSQAIRQLSATFAEEFLPELTKAIQQLTTTIETSEELRKEIQGLGQDVANAINIISKFDLRNLFSDIRLGLAGIALQKFGDFLFGFRDDVVKTNHEIEDLIATFKSVPKEASKVSRYVARVGAALKLLGTGFIALSGIRFVYRFFNARTEAQRLTKSIESLKNEIDTLQRSFTVTGESIPNFADKINSLEIARATLNVQNLRTELDELQTTLSIVRNRSGSALSLINVQDDSLLSIQELKRRLAEYEKNAESLGTLDHLRVRFIESIIRQRQRESELIDAINSGQETLHALSRRGELPLIEQVELLNRFRQEQDAIVLNEKATEAARQAAAATIANIDRERYRLYALITENLKADNAEKTKSVALTDQQLQAEQELFSHRLRLLGLTNRQAQIEREQASERDLQQQEAAQARAKSNRELIDQYQRQQVAARTSSAQFEAQATEDARRTGGFVGIVFTRLGETIGDAFQEAARRAKQAFDDIYDAGRDLRSDLEFRLGEGQERAEQREQGVFDAPPQTPNLDTLRQEARTQGVEFLRRIHRIEINEIRRSVEERERVYERYYQNLANLAIDALFGRVRDIREFAQRVAEELLSNIVRVQIVERTAAAQRAAIDAAVNNSKITNLLRVAGVDTQVANIQIANAQRVAAAQQAAIANVPTIPGIPAIPNLNLPALGDIATGGVGALSVASLLFPQEFKNLFTGIRTTIGEGFEGFTDFLGSLNLQFPDGTSRKVVARSTASRRGRVHAR